MNERIRAREIRVIDDDGGQLGIMTPREALLIARERGIDLIEVAPQAQPPVCKIMDYGKFKYEQAKKEKESAKKHKQSELKDIRLDPRYGMLSEHDLQTKVNHARKFLEDGDKVKVTFRFIGGQIRHPEVGARPARHVPSACRRCGADREAAGDGRPHHVCRPDAEQVGRDAGAKARRAQAGRRSQACGCLGGARAGSARSRCACGRCPGAVRAGCAGRVNQESIREE